MAVWRETNIDETRRGEHFWRVGVWAAPLKARILSFYYFRALCMGGSTLLAPHADLGMRGGFVRFFFLVLSSPKLFPNPLCKTKPTIHTHPRA